VLYRAIGKVLLALPARGVPVIRRGPRNILERHQTPKPHAGAPCYLPKLPAVPDPVIRRDPDRPPPPSGTAAYRRLSYWWAFPASDLDRMVEAYL
jgi:hypothetical protein